MERAAVLIGVKQPGGMQKLQAVDDCLKKMKSWAEDQHISHIEVITDETAPVTAKEIKDTVKKIIDLNTVEQLIVYFAGHGVNIRYGEYWLLSDAPVDTQAAVNVEGSVVLARQCGIPHVLLISDACRTAAEGIQAQFVTGSEIFPNEGPAGAEQCVDLFFASTLGKPALEVKNPGDAANAYRALYTEALVDALRGNSEPPLERATPQKGLVRPWPLKRYLQNEVARRLVQANVNPTITQTPDARITSDEKAWIAEVPLPPPTVVIAPPMAGAPGTGGRSGGGGTGGVFRIGQPKPWPGAKLPQLEVPLNVAAEELLRAGLEGRSSEPVASNVQGSELLNAGLARTGQAFGPDHFETRCGIKCNGKAVTAIWTARGNADLLAPDLVRLNDAAHPAQNVLLEFADHSGVVLPAIPEFLASLTFDDDGDLENVAYEPSANTAERWRWDEFSHRQERLGRLRSIVATSARLGVFRLEGENAAALAREMQYAKSVDPTMAIYAAYAYHDLQQTDRLSEMQHYLSNDLGFSFFDLALLTRSIHKIVDARDRVFPFYPMLGQGWALLKAFRVRLPPALEGIERHVLPSLWTTFDAAGVARLRTVMMSGEVQ